MNNFASIYDPSAKNAILSWKDDLDEDDIQDLIDDEISFFLVQLNPNSSHYDQVLDDLEADGMKSFDYRKDDQKAWRFIGFYGERSEDSVLNAFAGVAEACTQIDLDSL